jgi:hypothetical protein
MDLDSFRARLKARLAALRLKLGHDDEDVAELAADLEALEGKPGTKADEYTPPGSERP